MEYPNFKVCVRCSTFNHSKYITDAMNGFVMQQTDFPYVCCIVDDASPDGEQEVIRKYVSENFDLSESSCHFERETDYAFITYAQHKSNKNCYFAVLYLKENHYSIKKSKMPYLAEWQEGCEYHAVCEGDDYWIHPDKLQMQYDLLSQHSDYSLCGSNGLTIWENGTNAPSYFNKVFQSRELAPDDIIGKWSLPTASLFFRASVHNNYPEWTKKIYSGDQTLILIAMSKGKVYCLGELMTIYRRSLENKTSMSTKIAHGSNGLYYKHTLILYQEFNNYTRGKYYQYIEPVIKQMRDIVRFYDKREKCMALAVLSSPKFVLSVLMERISSKIKSYL